MSAAEWSEARGILSAADVIPVANEARAIAAEYFGTARAPGVISMFDFVRTQLDSTVSLADRESFVKDLADLLFAADGASRNG